MAKSVITYNVLVTRPAHQAKTLSDLIEQQGWQAIRFPTLEVVGLTNDKIQQQLKRLDKYDWLIFISTNAVNFALAANNGRIGSFKRCSVAVIGNATEKAILATGLTVDLIPENHFNTEGLLATQAMQHIKHKHCLIIRGQGGREALANSLSKRGAIVDYMEVYKRVIPIMDSCHVHDMLRQQTLDVITITSGDALKNLIIMIGTELKNQLLAIPLIVISNRIKQLAEKSGFKKILVTESPSDAAIIKTVLKMSSQAQNLINGEYSGRRIKKTARNEGKG